ncbi:MAG: PTS sugar transporter subunit IIA [Pseudomonadota bacterium]
MELSVSQLSKHLNVSPDTIERWLRQGKLPVSRQGTNYRFRTQELIKWASNNNIRLDLSEKKVLLKNESSIISLSSAVQNGGIYFDVQGNNVNTVLESAITKITGIPDEHKPELLEQLIDRENALSTGIGNGFAIPHSRQQLDYLDNPMVSVCFLSKPVDYKALDNKNVAILFFIFCPVLKMHLHLLSAISFCLKDSYFVEFINSKPAPDELIEKIEVLQKTNPI